MEIILKQDIIGLGYKNDIVKCKEWVMVVTSLSLQVRLLSLLHLLRSSWLRT